MEIKEVKEPTILFNVYEVKEKNEEHVLVGGLNIPEYAVVPLSDRQLSAVFQNFLYESVQGIPRIHVEKNYASGAWDVFVKDSGRLLFVIEKEEEDVQS